MLDPSFLSCLINFGSSMDHFWQYWSRKWKAWWSSQCDDVTRWQTGKRTVFSSWQPGSIVYTIDLSFRCHFFHHWSLNLKSGQRRKKKKKTSKIEAEGEMLLIQTAKYPIPLQQALHRSFRVQGCYHENPALLTDHNLAKRQLQLQQENQCLSTPIGVSSSKSISSCIY